MTFHFLEQQRRTIGPLVVNLTDRAELMLRIDLDSDLRELVLFFQNFEKLMQVHHDGIIPLNYSLNTNFASNPSTARALSTEYPLRRPSKPLRRSFTWER